MSTQKDDAMKRTVTDRGFTHMEPVVADDGGVVKVYESSAASAPHIWLAIADSLGARAWAHLTLEQAEQVERQLGWLRENHVEVWRWYCRVDGAQGVADSRDARDRDAAAHRDVDCKAHDKPVAEWVEAGHLVHVWRW